VSGPVVVDFFVTVDASGEGDQADEDDHQGEDEPAEDFEGEIQDRDRGGYLGAYQLVFHDGVRHGDPSNG